MGSVALNKILQCCTVSVCSRHEIIMQGEGGNKIHAHSRAPLTSVYQRISFGYSQYEGSRHQPKTKKKQTNTA